MVSKHKMYYVTQNQVFLPFLMTSTTTDDKRVQMLLIGIVDRTQTTFT